MLCERGDADILLILSSLYSKGKMIVVTTVCHRTVLDGHLGWGMKNDAHLD